MENWATLDLVICCCLLIIPARTQHWQYYYSQDLSMQTTLTLRNTYMKGSFKWSTCIIIDAYTREVEWYELTSVFHWKSTCECKRAKIHVWTSHHDTCTVSIQNKHLKLRRVLTSAGEVGFPPSPPPSLLFSPPTPGIPQSNMLTVPFSMPLTLSVGSMSMSICTHEIGPWINQTQNKQWHICTRHERMEKFRDQ